MKGGMERAVKEASRIAQKEVFILHNKGDDEMCEPRNDSGITIKSVFSDSNSVILNGITYKRIGVRDDGGVLFHSPEANMDRVLRPMEIIAKKCNCANCTCKKE